MSQKEIIGNEIPVDHEPFDPTPHKNLIQQILETKGGKITSSMGGGNYHWAYLGDVEDPRLELQAKTRWGQAHREQHELLSRNISPKKIAVIGTSVGADQIKTILDLYPTAEVQVIENDKRKCIGALAALEKTHSEDVKSKRVTIVEEDAMKRLSAVGDFGMIEIDKVLIHLPTTDSNPRAALIKTAYDALAEGGILHIGDILAPQWDASADKGFEENPDTLGAIAKLKNLMPAIIDVSWTKRGAPVWGNIEELNKEILVYVPGLQPVDEFTKSYKPDPTPSNTLEGYVSQYIALMPFLGIKGRVRQLQGAGQNTNGLEMAEKAMYEIAKGFVSAAQTPGVLLRMPSIAQLTYKKSSA